MSKVRIFRSKEKLVYNQSMTESKAAAEYTQDWLSEIICVCNVVCNQLHVEQLIRANILSLVALYTLDDEHVCDK